MNFARNTLLATTLVTNEGLSTMALAQPDAPAAVAEPQEQSQAQQLMGATAQKLPELTDDILYADIWERTHAGDPAGGTAWLAPGIKHWHGAAAEVGMSHIAFSEALDGKTVDWMEQVTGEQYSR